MKNQIVKFILIILCLFAISVVSAENYRCTASKLNIRESASKSGKVVGQIVQNETVDILSINGEWGVLLFHNDTGYVNMQYLEVVQNYTPTVDKVEEEWTDGQKAIFWICFIAAIGIYAFAIYRVRNGELVVIKGWLDLGLLVFPCIVLWITLFSLGSLYVILGKYIYIALLIISGLCLIASLALSVIANWGNVFNIIFSLIMKIVVIPIIGFGVFYLISKILGKTGISRKSVILFGILGILIGGLISLDE